MRVAIWSIVGILVVAGAIFFFVARSQNAGAGSSGQLTAEEIRKVGERELKKAQDYLTENKKLQDALASAGKLNDAARAKLAELDAKANQIKAKATELQAATDKAAVGIRKELAGLTKEYTRIKRELKKGQ